MRESKSPGPASASRGAKTALRAVFRAGEIPRGEKVDGGRGSGEGIGTGARRRGGNGKVAGGMYAAPTT